MTAIYKFFFLFFYCIREIKVSIHLKINLKNNKIKKKYKCMNEIKDHSCSCEILFYTIEDSIT